MILRSDDAMVVNITKQLRKLRRDVVRILFVLAADLEGLKALLSALNATNYLTPGMAIVTHELSASQQSLLSSPGYERLDGLCCRRLVWQQRAS